MDIVPTKKPKLVEEDWKKESSSEEKQNPSPSKMIKQAIAKAHSTLRNMDSTGNFLDLSNKRETHIIGRAIWALEGINSGQDLDMLAKNAGCLLVTEKFRLRFYFNKLEMTTEEQDRYVSLCVAAQNGGGNAEEALAFTVKVDRLTEDFKVDYNQMPETEVKILTPEEYFGVVVAPHFLNYACSSLPTSSMKFGITVSVEIPAKMSMDEAATLEGCDRVLTSMLHAQNPDSAEDSILDTTMTAKANVKLDAKNFMLAARSQDMMMKVELDKTEQDFDPKVFLQSILDWIYLGKISESTGKVLQKLLEDINTKSQVTALRWSLEEEVLSMTYGNRSDSPQSKKREGSLRIELGKYLTMSKINKFIWEFAGIIDSALSDE